MLKLTGMGLLYAGLARLLFHSLSSRITPNEALDILVFKHHQIIISARGKFLICNITNIFIIHNLRRFLLCAVYYSICVLFCNKSQNASERLLAGFHVEYLLLAKV